jgi:hypothetical protein
MTTDFTLRVTLELGSHRRVFEAAELAAALGDDGLEPALLAILFRGPCPQAVNKGRGTLGGGVPRPEKNANVDKHSFVRSGRDRGCRGEGRKSEAEELAQFLADRLQDQKSLALYRRIARAVPADVVRDCLGRALDLPASQVRRSRAAYFTAMCLPYLRLSEHEQPSSYPS